MVIEYASKLTKRSCLTGYPAQVPTGWRGDQSTVGILGQCLKGYCSKGGDRIIFSLPGTQPTQTIRQALAGGTEEICAVEGQSVSDTKPE